MVADSRIIGANVIRQRELQRLTRAELSRKAGVSAPTLTRLEAGESSPQFATLSRVAAALEVSVDVLLKPPVEQPPVRFRAKVVNRRQILDDVTTWLHERANLEARTGEPTEFALGDLAADIGTRPPGRERAVYAAKRARAALGLDDASPVADVAAVLERCAGVRLHTPSIAHDGFWGLSIGCVGTAPAVVANAWSPVTVERRIFSAVHELGHVLLHLQSFDAADDRREDHDVDGEESEADVFASHFLMPERAFREVLDANVWNPWVECVLATKKHFGVSYATVLYRCAESDKERRHQLFVQFRALLKRVAGVSLPSHAEPEPLPESAFVPRRTRELVMLALDRRLISLDDGARILRTTPESLQSDYAAHAAELNAQSDRSQPKSDGTRATRGKEPAMPPPE